ncbi:chitin synthase regulator 3 [Sporormia fimetaria CBS 119925]|uniref:Chitin synthase regulator 3 n=1 Tax=Sporormia fimetaria CBS 119925 TaxID=1340428 RepID=A0A6A6VNA8_9PLEO|nr:chitin synthase regulator 3 [Sporormia fimetaria CBS 119925]
MSYNQGAPQPKLGATFVPGGFDDYYMPVGSPEVISPAPQRIMPEVPENMQDNINHMELEANPPRGPTSPMHAHNPADQHFPPRSTSYQSEQPANDANWPQRHQSISSTFKQPPTVQPHSIQHEQASHDYNQFGASADIPNFSIFPKLQSRPPNVPPSDDEKEAVLENARLPVLNSNDPEMQLAWAQDALIYVEAAQLCEQRLSELHPARPVTPQVEHQLRVDAMNVVGFLADQHHPKAEFMRGMWLEFGKFGLRADKKEAFRCYDRAAKKGYARAEYRMGMLYEQANDPIKALQHYTRGSEAGDSASNYRLGMMTLLGQHGQPQDYAKGIHLIKLAADGADENAPQGAYVLGMLLARELPQVNVPDLPYDEKGARVNIEKAAYLGFAKAQLKMGSAYELCSLGCDFSPTLSMHYNALASRQGEAEADMAISKWFLCGYEPVFPKNEELAYEYAHRAAVAQLATAEFAMGYFNEIGMHVPVNLEKALEWYEKASRNGNKDAVARIESISKSRTLSKTDHEKVAINKIKSQHGSMRGQRPARLQKMAVPSLPTVQDGETSPGYPAGRGTTPYPESDQPPAMHNMPPRSATAAPYPMDNGPPRVGSARPPMAGGFAPEMRSASARPSAFNINPNVYGSDDQYGRGGPPPHGPPQGPGNMGPIPLRPHTSMDNMGQGRGRMPSGARIPSAPGPGAYRQPGGPSAERPEAFQRPSTAQPVDIGYSSPDNRNRLQKQGGPPNRPHLPDVGYVAPLDSRQHTRPATAQPGIESRTNPGPRPSTTAPRPGPGAGPGGPGRPPRGESLQASNAPRPGPQQAAKPSTKPHSPKPPATSTPSTPGKGPKTFDEMGVAPPPKDQDCVVM